MRCIMIAIVAIVAGCAPGPEAPAAKTTPQSSHDKTREWLGELPTMFVWHPINVQDRESHGRDRQFDFQGWVERGKAIDGAEMTLIGMIDKPNSDVDLERAAFALGEIGSADSVRALLDCLNRDDPGLQTKAVEALGKLRDARAVEPLATRLTFVAAGNESVQMAIIDSLAEIGNDAAVGYLKKAADQGSNLIAEPARVRLEEIQKAGGSKPPKIGVPSGTSRAH